MNNTTNRKKSIYLKTAISMLITSAIAIFLILLFLRPTVYLSKQSGFPKNEAVTYKNGKIRFIVPESADIINHTQIPIEMNWFTTNRLGSVVSVLPKQGKALALDFTNLKHDEVIFEITVKNLFGIKTKYDVIIDYSNYLRIFFEKNHLGQTRKPIVLPYYKLDHEFRHIKEELYKLESFYRFDKDGKKEEDTVSKSLVFSKNEAKGHAFLVNTTDEIIVNYDFVLSGIFENNAQKTFILERISKSQKTLKTLNPKDKGLKLKFNQAPFYVTEFLGWFYYDETGNRVNVGIGEEITIPSWVKSEFKLTARYKYEISNQAGDDINKMGYVAISYFDGPERVYFAIIKKGSPVENFKPNKPGYETLGWYTDEALTKAYDFTPGNNIADKNMSLYLKSRRTSTDVPHDHKITFITPAYANQLVPVYTMHGDKLDLNYSLPSMVTGYENGQFTELDYWTIVDPVSGKDTGKRFDFNTPIKSDLTLKAHMRELKLPTPDRDVKFRVIDSIDGKVVYEKTLTLKDNKIQDKDKAEINAVLAQKLTDKNHLLGKFTFKDWYLNADINKKFNINDTVEPGISELNVFGLYNFKASDDIPDPNNPNNPKPLDPSLIKVTFLSDTTSVLSVQTSPKNSTFKGTLPEVSKAGYRFKYWAYFKDNEIKGQFGLNDVLTENTTLYPIFEKDPNSPLPDTTVVATIVNKLLGTKEVRLVKKGELLDLNPQQYTTHLSPYLYEFSRFANENGTSFNYLTERIFSNKTIYVEHTKVARDQVNYEIKHVFEGKEGEADRIETVTKQALVDSLVTVSPSDKLQGHEHGFELETTQSETKQVSSEFTTQFTLKYRRRRFDVNFETNFNNRFDGDVSPSSKQKVKYEGTATEPANPAITKPGYKYTFVQWQLKSSMNGEYIKTQAYDFSQPVTGNVELVAYFKEEKTTTTFQIKHVIEGVDDIQEETRVVTKTAKVGSTFTATNEHRLPEFDEHFTVDTQSQTQKIKGDGTTVFTLNYVRKSYTVTYEVNFNGTQFTDAMFGNEPQTQSIKYQGKITKPAVSPTLSRVGYSYTFVQWQEKTAMNGQYKPTAGFNFNDFRVEKDITLVAYFAETANAVNYTINHVIEGTDDGIAEQTITRTYTAIADSNHTVSRAQRLPEYEEHFTVAEQTQTKQIKPDGTTVFTLEYKRKTYTVNFEVNYNGTQFSGVSVENQPQSVQVKYQGKVQKPAIDPKLTKTGYNYTFVQWQEKTAMNGTYSQIQEYDFANTRIVGNTTLVAYFTENAKSVNYTINHVFEGVDDIAQRTDAKVHQALADSSVTVSKVNRLTEFDEHFTVEDQTQTKNINRDGSTVFTLNYVRKSYTVTYEVNYNGNHFSDVTVGNQPQSTQVKYEGKITKPVTNPTLTKEGYNYQFVHWQEKTTMNGTYSQIAEFNFANQRITRNTTLVAYFTENAKSVNYTINHVFQGVGDIAQRTDARVHQALADSSKTITYADRLTEYDEHFNVDTTYQMTEKIDRLGTTVFTIVYRRKLYDVYYEVQYNDNQFDPGFQIHTPVAKYLQVPYQGKAPKPHDPVVSKEGYTYTFVHWQLKEEMNGTYQKVSAYDFNQGVEKNITLVAYFEEKLNKVNYQVTYFLEKQGESSSLNDTYQEVTKTYTAPAFSQVHLQPYQDLDLTKYDADTVDGRNKLHATLTHENNTVVLKKYYQLKQYQISFAANDLTFGNIPITPDYQKVTRKVNSSQYHFSANQGYKFIGISLDGNENNLIESFIMPASDVVVTAIFKENKKAIIYNIRLENADGTFTTQTKTYYAKLGTIHYTTFENPDTNIYEEWEADKNSLVVSESQVQNLVFIKVTRKKFKVTFNVLNSYVTIQERTRRYSEQIGEIKHYSLRQIDILLFKLDGVKKSKLEVETHEVTSNLTVEIKILNDRKANHYPQTEVALSQSSIWKEQEYPSLELVLVFNGEVLRTSYTRKVVFDKNEEQYEVIAGKYYKYEPIEFVQIPGNTGYFTKKIIDAIPFSLYQQDKDVQFDGSIFMEQIKNIGHISWLRDLNAPLISFDDSPTSLENAIRDPQLKPQLRKEPTDYAKAIFRQYTGVSKFWRGIDFTALPHGYAQNDSSYLPIYEQSEMMTYWCSVIGKENQNVGFMRPYHITTELNARLSNPNIVRGLVLAKEKM